MRKIRVSWKYPDIYTRPDDPYMHKDFEIDDDATPEEIQNEAEEIAFEHFSWSFWDVTKEHENEKIKEITDHGQDHMDFICDQCHHTASIDTLDVLIAEDNLHCPICGASSEHLTLKEHKNDKDL